MEEEVCESDQGNPSDQADKMEEEVRESDQESLSDQKDMEEEVPESDQEKEFTPEAMLESVENISIVDGDHKTKLLENKRKEESVTGTVILILLMTPFLRLFYSGKRTIRYVYQYTDLDVDLCPEQ